MEPRPAGVWRTFSALGALALVAGTIGFLVLTRTGTVDAAEIVSSAFEVGELPQGFAPGTAIELPGGQSLVLLSSGVAQPLLEAESGTDQQADWRKVPISPSANPPAEVRLHFLGANGRGAARRALEFEGETVAGLQDKGGTIAVESGVQPWDAFEPRFLHTRRFVPPGQYQDFVAIDLSAHGRWCVLYAIWDPNQTGSKEALFAIAEALKPKPPAVAGQ